MHQSEDTPQSEDLTSEELAHQQALKYGKDLARIYLAEKERRRQLENTNRLLTAIFDSTPVGIVVLDTHFAVRRTNRTFEHLVEQSASGITDQPIDAILGNPDLLPILQDLDTDTTFTQFELTVSQPVLRDLLLTLARLDDEIEPGWVLVVEDQSKRKLFERQKAEFINIAAHELRTPLASVIGYAELLNGDLSEEEKPNPVHHDYLDGIRKGAHRLHGIVNELLQFAELSGGSTEKTTSLTTHNLQNLLNEIAQNARLQANEPDIAVRVDCPPDLSITVEGAALRTALHQLIMNGIRFNEPGGNVLVSARQEDDIILLTVADTGKGIPQTDVDTVFEAFFQVEDSNIRRQGGLGLGLTIARRAVALMNGTISVDSVLGQGTTVTIKLPNTAE